MARERKRKDIPVENPSFVLDVEEASKTDFIPIQQDIEDVKTNKTIEDKYQIDDLDEELFNCLRNEKVIVRFIAKARGPITDPKHVMFGNKHEKSIDQFTTPLLRSGGYVDVLTKKEKKYLEYVLGLESNALSVYKKNDNFWSDANPNGIGHIPLKKGDNTFDMSDPMDYIRVKVLLANKNEIAPSLQEMQDLPKATYRYVVIKDTDSSKEAVSNVTMKARAYKEFGKMESDDDKMRTVIELFEGRPVSAKSGNDFLQGKIGEIIEANTKMFLNIASDPLLDNKVLIKKAIDAGIIVNRGTFLYMKDTNSPLCGDGQDPTLSVAAKYLSLPKNQELKFRIEAELKK